jgi:hypothetical protein
MKYFHLCGINSNEGQVREREFNHNYQEIF